jgi:predicted alpha/beta hydrolase family esterase
MSGVRILILHGWQGSGPEHWQTLLAERMRAAGHHVQYPSLPDCDLPCPDRWGVAFREEIARLADGPGERVVCAHSLGCVLWLREAARLTPGQRVDRVALVAPPCPGAEVPELAGFYPTGAERDAVAAAAVATRLVCSEDDGYCPGGAARVWGAPLALPVDLLAGAGHINVEAGFGAWPEIEQWCLGRRATLAPEHEPAQSIGAKNGAEM